MTDSEFLNWIADRLVHVHGDPENVDFVLHLRKLALREVGAAREPSEQAIDAFAWSVTAGAPELMQHERVILAEGLRAAYAVDFRGAVDGSPAPSKRALAFGPPVLDAGAQVEREQGRTENATLMEEIAEFLRRWPGSSGREPAPASPNVPAGVTAYLDWKASGDSSPANLVHAILQAVRGSSGGAGSPEPSAERIVLIEAEIADYIAQLCYSKHERQGWAKRIVAVVRNRLRAGPPQP